MRQLCGSNIVRLLNTCKRQKVKEGQKTWLALGRNLRRLRGLGKWYVCLDITTWGSPPSAKTPQGCLTRHAGDCQSPEVLAFPCPCRLGVWNGLCSEVTSPSVQAGWVFVPPSSAESKPTLCIPDVSQGSGAVLPELLEASFHNF